MTLWYRHSGEPEVEEFPDISEWADLKVVDLEEIISAVGDYHITHMWIEGDMTSPLSAICQRLTHLRMTRIFDPLQLQKYVKIHSAMYLAIIIVLLYLA